MKNTLRFNLCEKMITLVWLTKSAMTALRDDIWRNAPPTQLDAFSVLYDLVVYNHYRVGRLQIEVAREATDIDFRPSFRDDELPVI